MTKAIILSISFLFATQASWAAPSELYTPIEGEAQNGLFVRSGLGLTESMKEINRVVTEAQSSKVLTKVEANEYNRRIAEAQAVLEASKAQGVKLTFDQIQTLAKDIASVAEALNNKLSPLTPSYAITDRDLEADYKQLKTRVAQRLRDGRLDAVNARRISSEAKRVYETALADKSTDTIEDASRELHKLDTRMQTQSAYRIKAPDVAGSFLNYPRVF